MKNAKDEVPPERYVLLDHTVNSMFGDQPRLRNFIWRSFQKVYIRIGDIVQESKQEYFKKVPTKPVNQEKIIKGLQECGLHFGMIAPGWKPPTHHL